MMEERIVSLFGDVVPPEEFKPLIPLIGCEDENMEPIIEDTLFYKTYALEHGLKESYKSWFAGYIALCVATGTPFFGRKILKPGIVVYVYGEGAMIKRFKSLCRGFDIEFPSTLYPYKYKDELSRREAIEDIKNHIPSGTVLIVFDNYEKFWSSHGEEKVVSPAVKFLQRISDFATVLLIQHQPKNASKGSAGHKNAIGLSRIVNAADTTFELKRSGATTTCKVYHREAEPPKDICFALKKLSEDSFILCTPGLADSLRESQSQKDGCFKKVIEALVKAITGNTPYTKTYIYEQYLKNGSIEGLSTSVFFNEIAPRLIDGGYLFEKTEGKYIFKPLPEAF